MNEKEQQLLFLKSSAYDLSREIEGLNQRAQVLLKRIQEINEQVTKLETEIVQDSTKK